MQHKREISLYTTSITRVVISATSQNKSLNHRLLRSLTPIGALLVVVLYLLIPLILLLHVVAVWLFSLIGAATFLALIEALMVITLMRIDRVGSPTPVTWLQDKPIKPMQSVPHNATKAVAAIIAPRLQLPAYSGQERAWPGIKRVVVDVPRLKLPARG